MDRHYGNCNGKDCKKRENVMIVHGWTTRDGKLCAPCNFNRLRAAKSIKVNKGTGRVKIVATAAPQRQIPISQKPTDRLAEARDKDWEVNQKIWEERRHVCVEDGKWLAVDPPPKAYFSHVLGKGAHPELRHDPENIVLHCIQCHRKWETAGKEKREMETYKLKLAYMIEKGFVPND